jgi:hypothetical protein
MHKVVAGIHVASATSMEVLVKGFAEGSIHAELATMLRNSITNTILVGHSWGKCQRHESSTFTLYPHPPLNKHIRTSTVAIQLKSIAELL